MGYTLVDLPNFLRANLLQPFRDPPPSLLADLGRELARIHAIPLATIPPAIPHMASGNPDVGKVLRGEGAVDKGRCSASCLAVEFLGHLLQELIRTHVTDPNTSAPASNWLSTERAGSWYFLPQRGS